MQLQLSFEDVEKFVDENMEVIDYNNCLEKKVAFEIVKNYGKLSDKKAAPIFSKINWNGYIRYDLRKWNADMTKPYKGITFNEEEVQLLSNLKQNKFSIKEVPVIEYSGGKAKAKIYGNILRLDSTIEKNVVWNKEVNIVDWGYGKKVDIRKWTEDYSKCGKGICITIEEFGKMIQLL